MSDGAVGIVMERADKGTLQDSIRKLTVPQKVTIARGIVDGLVYLHSKKIVHRDLKPGNILLFGNKPTAKISDFGTSKMVQTFMESTKMIGTAKYCAPELLEPGHEYKTSVDVYSLSLILFELVTGEDLFKNCTSDLQVLTAILQNRRPTIPEDVPDALRSVLQKGWSQNPLDRPALSSFQETLQELSEDDLKKKETENKRKDENTFSEASHIQVPSKTRIIPAKDLGRDTNVYPGLWHSQEVAIKRFRILPNLPYLKALKSESNLAVKLLHPNIIRVYGTTKMSDGAVGIVMERADKGTLQDSIRKLTVPQKVTIARGIVDGLVYLHSKKIVHRDLKPGNILLFGNKPTAKISDFGTSKMVQTFMESTKMIGTAKYCAPELLEPGHEYKTSVDVYSLSLILFELVTGEDLFKNCTSDLQVLTAILQNRRPTIPEDVPDALRSVLQKGWSQNPLDRPALSSFQETLQELSEDDLKKKETENKRKDENTFSEASHIQVPSKTRIIPAKDLGRDTSYFSAAGAENDHGSGGRGDDDEEAGLLGERNSSMPCGARRKTSGSSEVCRLGSSVLDNPKSSLDGFATSASGTSRFSAETSFGRGTLFDVDSSSDWKYKRDALLSNDHFEDDSEYGVCGEKKRQFVCGICGVQFSDVNAHGFHEESCVGEQKKQDHALQEELNKEDEKRNKEVEAETKRLQKEEAELRRMMKEAAERRQQSNAAGHDGKTRQWSRIAGRQEFVHGSRNQTKNVWIEQSFPLGSSVLDKPKLYSDGFATSASGTSRFSAGTSFGRGSLFDVDSSSDWKYKRDALLSNDHFEDNSDYGAYGKAASAPSKKKTLFDVDSSSDWKYKRDALLSNDHFEDNSDYGAYGKAASAPSKKKQEPEGIPCEFCGVQFSDVNELCFHEQSCLEEQKKQAHALQEELNEENEKRNKEVEAETKRLQKEEAERRRMIKEVAERRQQANAAKKGAGKETTSIWRDGQPPVGSGSFTNTYSYGKETEFDTDRRNIEQYPSRQFHGEGHERYYRKEREDDGDKKNGFLKRGIDAIKRTVGLGGSVLDPNGSEFKPKQAHALQSAGPKLTFRTNTAECSKCKEQILLCDLQNHEDKCSDGILPNVFMTCNDCGSEIKWENIAKHENMSVQERSAFQEQIKQRSRIRLQAEMEMQHGSKYRSPEVNATDMRPPSSLPLPTNEQQTDGRRTPARHHHRSSPADHYPAALPGRIIRHRISGYPAG
ncbi:unnamed protein product [Cyprideis torosa]|uniref:Uncharacterized protein n=1 Tax=Cyprideis torosa TaxID=163714 RepID=A0A7R8ZQK4_9CRUS|nr:unnamed protein product [Cyprideis torosa]CAG0896616.1 unnamed protein product [Cyprideis torosa]